ncbi:Protein translation factor SUI1 [Wickerhamiella sorbophila]|uniref:Protein translation factor SUI1 n=1 Tax=Wickerhamiella sorbophila TaxID=45607 RepID=A0A2T0FL89_9ASCO|nr:Protein translation factor SUI1 [Wickerhamiella sorbophila]PRT55749.1 Protein translation factor SUI1 [Wickerhamiella sorbophila]
MASIDNLKTFDPFADTGDEALPTALHDVHIRCQQRNGRKTITTVEGIPSEYDLKRILKTLKKDFGCNGHINKDTDHGEILQFQGDQRQKIQEFLIEALQIKKEQIKIHGF